MKRILLATLLLIIGLSLGACEKPLSEIKKSLAGTTWKNSDGITLVFYKTTVTSNDGYRNHMGKYEYSYPTLIVFWDDDYNGKTSHSGTFSRKKLTMQLGYRNNDTFWLVE